MKNEVNLSNSEISVKSSSNVEIGNIKNQSSPTKKHHEEKDSKDSTEKIIDTYNKSPTSVKIVIAITMVFSAILFFIIKSIL